MKTNLVLLSIICPAFLFSQTSIVLQPDGTEGKDARVFNIGAEINYGDDPDFIASTWTYSGEPGTMRSMIQFDLSGIPAGAGIVDARLYLYYNADSSTPGQAGENAAFLRRITGPWEESTVRWLDQPNYSTVNQVYIPESTTSNQSYEGIDVAPLIRDMLEFPNQSFGFMFMGENEAPLNSMKFYSSDGPVPNMRPKLVVFYILEPVNCQTFQPGNAGKDAKLYSLEPETNFGNDEDLIAAAWNFGGTDGLMRSMIDFDMSSLPANANVLSASLSLYYNSNSSSPGQAGPNAALLQRLVQPFSEFGTTWGDQPLTTTEHQVLIPASISTDQDYENINVTELIRDMLESITPEYGMLLRLETEENFRAIKFASSDHQDDTKWPKLEICYTIGTATRDESYQEITAFPNPFTNSFQLTGLTGMCHVSMYDMHGNLVYSIQRDAQDQTVTLDQLSAIPPGIYFVKVNAPDGTYISRIVKME